MWWFELFRQARPPSCPAGRGWFRASRGIAMAASASLLLTGCFTPLYGPTATGGNVKDVMATIDVAAAGGKVGQERIAHYLRNELVFDLDGSGRPTPKRYKLDVTVNESLSAVTVNTQTGQASSAILTGTAAFKLIPIAGGPEIIAGTATASASYDRGPQRFANLRASRDAEIRVAKTLAEQIQTRIAVTLKNRA
jgi:LPS-assembly lipoprotein